MQNNRNFLYTSKINRGRVLIASGLLLTALLLYYNHEKFVEIGLKTMRKTDSNPFKSDSDNKCQAWSDAPSLSIMCRAYSGSVLEYYNVFLVGYHLFWPKEQWPNSDLVVVLDDENELDHRLGSVLANLPPYPKVHYEKMPTEQTFCSQDRRIGYSRQQYSNFYSDLYSGKDFIGIVDSDSVFSTMVIPDTLFVNGKPRIYG